MLTVRALDAGRVVGALDSLAEHVESPDQAIREIADQAAATVAAKAPKRTGRLAAAARPLVSRAKASVVVDVVYAGPINYGWASRNITPAHFIAGTDPVMEPVAARLLDDDIDRGIRSRGLA